MIESIRFVVLAWRAYQQARRMGRPQYSALTTHGIPQVCIFVGVGREAWRISQWAIQEWKP